MNANISPLSPYELNPQFNNLAGANRLERALAIFSKSHDIKKVAPNSWTVKSQMGFVSYLVQHNGESWSCTCPDHIKNGCECKHILAVKEYLKAKEEDLAGKKANAEAQGKVFRDWNNYTLAQMSEFELFPVYLKELVGLVQEPVREGAGRPSVPLADSIFMAVSKVASMRSSRRAYGEIINAEKSGNIERQYGYNNKKFNHDYKVSNENDKCRLKVLETCINKISDYIAKYEETRREQTTKKQA